MYVLSIFALGDDPSIIAMEERKTSRLVGVKMSWSIATRAIVVVVRVERFTRRWRKANQVVAAGPKIAGGVG